MEFRLRYYIKIEYFVRENLRVEIRVGGGVIGCQGMCNELWNVYWFRDTRISDDFKARLGKVNRLILSAIINYEFYCG